MKSASRKIIAACHEVETGTFLIGNDNRKRVGKLLTVDRIEHGRVQGVPPKALAIPGRSCQEPVVVAARANFW